MNKFSLVIWLSLLVPPVNATEFSVFIGYHFTIPEGFLLFNHGETIVLSRDIKGKEDFIVYSPFKESQLMEFEKRGDIVEIIDTTKCDFEVKTVTYADTDNFDKITYFSVIRLSQEFEYDYSLTVISPTTELKKDILNQMCLK